MAVALPDREPVIVVAAGGANTGKTTALNNIFGTDFPTTETRYSAVREVCRDGRSYILVDTPGFRSTMNMSDERVGECITDALQGLDFTLLFCLPAYSGSFYISDDIKLILINLQKCLHNRIWEKCVLLLTFSDSLRNVSTNTRFYKDSIRNFAMFFKRLLDTTFDKNFSVHTIFDYKDDYTRQYCGYSGIVAVPVQKEKDSIKESSAEFNRNPDIIPGISLKESWISCLFNEINTKIAPLDSKLKAANFKTVEKVAAEEPEFVETQMSLRREIGIISAFKFAVTRIILWFTYVKTHFRAYVSYLKWTSRRPKDQVRRLRERINREKKAY